MGEHRYWKRLISEQTFDDTCLGIFLFGEYQHIFLKQNIEFVMQNFTNIFQKNEIVFNNKYIVYYS